MDYILDGIKEGFLLIISGDMEVYRIIALSLYVSITSVIIATLISLPIGIITGLKEFRGKQLFARFLYTFMGMPPVVLGLIVFMFISRRGPLGQLELIYTPTAMIIAQTLLVIPIIMGNIFNSSKAHGQEIKLSCKTLGAGKVYTLWVLIQELRGYILIAVVTGFGRATSEVGAIMLVGGNIRGKTRAMTTYIAMNNGMGNIATSMAMGMVLLTIAFVVNGLIHKTVMGAQND